MASPSRDDAWQLLTEWTPSEALRKHGLAVEATVSWYAENRFGIAGPELETWSIAGLLHDFDYERYPETHPMRGAEELRRLGYPESRRRGGPGPRRPHRRAAGQAFWRRRSTPATS
jgi:predicted hydrolase (HD superfamily)